MTAWDKMQAHEIYNDFDGDLFSRRTKSVFLSWKVSPKSKGKQGS